MNQLDKNSYTLFLNSSDKVSGTNNNANYDVNWDDFLPRDIESFKVVYSFQTAGGYYRDNFSTFKVTTLSAPVQCTYQIDTPAVYNATTNTTSFVVSVLATNAIVANVLQITPAINPLLINNTIIYGGKNNLITQQASAVGDTCIVQGNLSGLLLNTYYYSNWYTQLTCDTATVNNYLGSLTVGQVINYNGSTYPILKIGPSIGASTTAPNNALSIIVQGIIFSSQIPRLIWLLPKKSINCSMRY